MAELLDPANRAAAPGLFGGRYLIKEVRRAHEDLLARTSFGKLILDV
jgi:hypothetical protein